MMSQFAAAVDGCGYRSVALLLFIGLSSQVHAQAADALQLTWQAPANCPDEQTVRARIRALAGSTQATAAQLRAAGTVTQRPDGKYVLKLVIHLDQLVGERELEARTCEALAGATAVNLALLLKAPSLSEAAGPNPSAASAPDAAPVDNPGLPQPSAVPDAARATSPTLPQPAAAPDASRSDATGSGVRAFLQLPRLALGFGPLAAPSVGVSLAAGAELELWTLGAGASWWLPHTQSSDRPNTEVQLQRISANLHVCRTFRFGRLGVAPCLTASLEHISARGQGPYVRSATAATTWLAAGLGVQTRFGLTHWLNVLGGAELKLQAARPRIAIDGVGQVAQLGSVAAELFFAAEWIL